jgi:hypothetical protein
MVVQMDGTLGSAVAGRFRCFTQAAVNTPEAFFGGGRPAAMDFAAQWQEVPDTLPIANPFRFSGRNCLSQLSQPVWCEIASSSYINEITAYAMVANISPTSFQVRDARRASAAP